MSELPLFSAPAWVPVSPRDTQLQAPKGAHLVGLRLDVLGYLVSRGNQGATDHEITAAIGKGEMRPRRVELCEWDYARETERRRTTPSGRTATVWIATPRGREAFALSKQVAS